MAVSCRRSASDHNYRNSSVIVDLDMGKIPRSRESISSYLNKTIVLRHIGPASYV